MPRKPKPPLIGAPYAPPPWEPGSSLADAIRGRLTAGGLSDAPIPWPYCTERAGGSGRSLILCGDLVRAVRTETTLAVAYHWGVGRRVVTRWRRSLGVGRMTEGTTERWRELAPRKLTRARRVAGGRAAAAAQALAPSPAPPRSGPSWSSRPATPGTIARVEPARFIRPAALTYLAARGIRRSSRSDAAG